jgi:chromate transport protein ChrA
VTVFQILRNSLAWLLAAQVAVISRHGLRLPIPIMLIFIVCLLWRVMVYQGRRSYPGRWSKVLLVFGGFVSIGAGYSTFLGLDPWVGLLIIAFLLKLLEMENKRDAYVVILLGYFVALTEFLYEKGIPYTLYMNRSVTMITAALI